LVAHAIPRFRQTDQSFGSGLDCALRLPAKTALFPFKSGWLAHVSATPPAVLLILSTPVPAAIGRNRQNPTPQRRIGGRRTL